MGPFITSPLQKIFSADWTKVIAFQAAILNFQGELQNLNWRGGTIMGRSEKISKTGKAKTMTSNMSDWYDCCWDPS